MPVSDAILTQILSQLEALQVSQQILQAKVSRQAPVLGLGRKFGETDKRTMHVCCSRLLLVVMIAT
ncbi:hypothetical protein BD410DRAFT_797108, partial [Rickenella mellea]